MFVANVSAHTPYYTTDRIYAYLHLQLPHTLFLIYQKPKAKQKLHPAFSRGSDLVKLEASFRL